MFEKPFKLDIVSPERVVFSGDVTAVSVPGSAGGFQVLHSHAPLVSSLEVGRITVKSVDGSDAHYATSGGFAEVRDNRMVLVVESVERADTIDVQRAQQSRQRAQERLSSRGPEIDVARAEASLLRALNRLRIAGRG